MLLNNVYLPLKYKQFIYYINKYLTSYKTQTYRNKRNLKTL